MSLNKQVLLDFLEELDKELERKITVVAVGGTAMTLHNAKESTIDVNFTIPAEDYAEFHRVLNLVPHGFKVDTWNNGMVFSQDLPDDYLKNSRNVRTKMKNMKLKTLDPLDIIVTKIGRLNERDKEDIAMCIKKFKITKAQIKKRAKQVIYTGREENYEINLNHVMKKFF
ncbi:DUF6036 family nucleotidyltransferase [Nitrosopumilus ureiphilus]|uniref:DUF6036 domain-containing protein n=1 Tax=Nitrosopumilus ureiphilus TaxID=1470067 RepID=A0A7D5M4Q7_9ARCH|nr:DUF6036 family nucleotidyltransferase [Nitrosopumilus ureiphilus]QLH06672.1 hypothetical protein C5F50_05970 [Nitrosopumilus ureiphilus]